VGTLIFATEFGKQQNLKSKSATGILSSVTTEFRWRFLISCFVHEKLSRFMCVTEILCLIMSMWTAVRC